MCFVRPSDLFRTASFRIGLFYAALFVASVSVLFVVIYVSTAGYTARQLTARIEADLAVLATEHVVGGRNNVIADIAARLDLGRGRYYLLQSPGGRVLAGNLGPWPARTGWFDLTAESNAGPLAGHHIRAKGAVLADGDFLLVGQDATQLDDLDHRVVQSFLWGTAATLLLAVIGALLMGMLSQRRLEAINRATEEIMAGNLERRIPLAGSHDEFDRLATQVNRMLERIESLMRGLQQVSNDIAHDLKTPLTRLRQHLELARHPALPASEAGAAIERAIAECDITLRTFDALLRIAQISAGTRRSAFRRFDLSASTATIVEAYQPVADESQHRLLGSVAPGVFVLGDPELVTQMLSNLVENAMKHTPGGTTIRVSLDARDGEGACLVVRDDGPGIPEAERDKVFRRFYRLEASRTTPGSGLGLALVEAVAALHGGSVRLSDAGPGLCVTLIFPGDAGAVPSRSDPV